MAFEDVKTPSTHIAGIDVLTSSLIGELTDQLDGQHMVGPDATVGDKYLVIPITSIPQLEEAEVTDEAGDIRKVAFALAELLYQVYAAMPAADRPANWTAYRTAGAPDDSGVRTPTYTNQFTVADSATEVIDEPA